MSRDCKALADNALVIISRIITLPYLPIWKVILGIGGAIAGILAIFASTKQSQSKKDFNRRVKANEDKLDFITKSADKVNKEKEVTKSNIKKTSAKIKTTKSKVKSTKDAKKTIDSFEKKYRKK